MSVNVFPVLARIFHIEEQHASTLISKINSHPSSRVRQRIGSALQISPEYFLAIYEAWESLQRDFSAANQKKLEQQYKSYDVHIHHSSHYRAKRKTPDQMPPCKRRESPSPVPPPDSPIESEVDDEVLEEAVNVIANVQGENDLVPLRFNDLGLDIVTQVSSPLPTAEAENLDEISL